MLLVAAVLEVADGRTASEIAGLTGLSLVDVQRALQFLSKYSFVEVRGSKAAVDRVLMSLPLD